MSKSIEAIHEFTLKAETFIDKHFADIAFTISAIVLAILSPLHVFLGAALGFAIHYFTEPDLRLKKNEKVISLPNTLFAIIGAMAALIRFTPAGATGGFVFKAIPFAASLAMGSTAYRATKSR